jgi:hypothetical protein
MMVVGKITDELPSDLFIMKEYSRKVNDKSSREFLNPGGRPSGSHRKNYCLFFLRPLESERKLNL